jgi:hypothetical protein
MTSGITRLFLASLLVCALFRGGDDRVRQPSQKRGNVSSQLRYRDQDHSQSRTNLTPWHDILRGLAPLGEPALRSEEFLPLMLSGWRDAGAHELKLRDRRWMGRGWVPFGFGTALFWMSRVWVPFGFGTALLLLGFLVRLLSRRKNAALGSKSADRPIGITFHCELLRYLLAKEDRELFKLATDDLSDDAAELIRCGYSRRIVQVLIHFRTAVEFLPLFYRSLRGCVPWPALERIAVLIRGDRPPGGPRRE